MIHEIDPTVKIWPGCGRDEELTERTILFDMETARTPLPGAPTVDGISSAVLQGVSHEGRLIGRGARNQEQEGNKDTRVRQVQADSTTEYPTHVVYWFVLAIVWYCMCFEGVPTRLI